NLLARRACGDARDRLALSIEGHERDDGQARHDAYRRDRALEIFEIEERLDHEEIDPATLEDLRLLCVPVLGVRTDRSGDEDVAARDLTRLAGESRPGRIDHLELVLEEVLGELRPVRAERVRLDQLRTGADIAEVDIDDAFRRA